MSIITVSEGLGLLKTLNQRYGELKALRDENANSERRFYGVGGDKTTEKTPVYNVKALDMTLNRLAMEIRKIDNAIKKHNAVTQLAGYDWDDALLGVIETV
jgi:hypothetical protein